MSKLTRFPKSSFNPENIKLKGYRGHIGESHIRPSTMTAIADARFAQIQLKYLSGEIDPSDPSLPSAMCLVLFDGVATAGDLKSALSNLADKYKWHDHVRLGWADGIGRQNGRHLSHFTINALAYPCKEDIEVGALLAELDGFLRGAVKLGGIYGLDLFLLDAQAWLYRVLSGPLLAHCLNTNPIASLPRSALAREEEKLALARQLPAGEPAERMGFGEALSGYFDSARSGSSEWLVSETMVACRVGKRGSDAQVRRQMLERCFVLARRASDAGRIPSLILAWAIDLIESGTPTKSVIDPTTASKYVQLSAKRIFHAFKNRELEEMRWFEFSEIYENLKAGLNPSQQTSLAAALHSWHHFLSLWLDVEPLRTSLHKGIKPSPPSANLLWPHEIERVSKWLDESDDDDRLQGQLRIAWAIARSVRVRARELIHLQMQNFRWADGVLEIEIATPARFGGLKTPAGRRVAVVAAHEAADQIAEWYARRKKEGALSADFFFGDPARPGRLYKIGVAYYFMNQLIKSATGDPTMSLHTLSHTVITRDGLASMDTDKAVDINQFERNAAAFGHASALTGFGHYFHQPENPLRLALDREIYAQLSWSHLRRYIPLGHAAYRQRSSRAKRNGEDQSAVVGDMLRMAAPSLLSPTAADRVELGEPMQPKLLSKPKPPGINEIIGILSDLSRGEVLDVISLKYCLSPEFTTSVARHGLGVLADLGEVSWQAQYDKDLAHHFLRVGNDMDVRKRIGLEKVEHHKLATLIQWLDDHMGDDKARMAVKSWQDCYYKGYLALTNLSRAAGLVDLLDAAGVSRNSVLIRTSLSDTDLDERKTRVAIEYLFMRGNSVPPLWEQVDHRRGRPKAYIALLSQPEGTLHIDSYPNAATAMSGFHAVMLAAAVLARRETAGDCKPAECINKPKNEGSHG